MAKGHSVSTSSLLLECQPPSPPPPPPPPPEQFFAEKMEQEEEDKNVYVNVNQIDEPVQSAGVAAEDDSESTYYITPTVQPIIPQAGKYSKSPHNSFSYYYILPKMYDTPFDSSLTRLTYIC